MPGEQKKVCIDVPYIDQSKLYPTGCESVSTPSFAIISISPSRHL